MITSRQNQYVKLFRSLASAKGRREQGLFAVEGAHLIEEMLAVGWKARLGFVAPELVRDPFLAERLRQNAELYLEVTAEVFCSLSDTRSPQGLAAALPLPGYELSHIPAQAGVVLALWEIRDPGNMGTMLRTAWAAGARGVLAVGECVDFYAPKVVRAAAGAVFHLPLVEISEAQLVRWAQEEGRELVAAVVEGGAPLPQCALSEQTVLLIGSEAQGLPETLLTVCAQRVTIPMPGRAESLNAAVAAGILLYEYIRQRL